MPSAGRAGCRGHQLARSSARPRTRLPARPRTPPVAALRSAFRGSSVSSCGAQAAGSAGRLLPSDLLTGSRFALRQRARSGRSWPSVAMAERDALRACGGSCKAAKEGIAWRAAVVSCHPRRALAGDLPRSFFGRTWPTSGEPRGGRRSRAGARSAAAAKRREAPLTDGRLRLRCEGQGRRGPVPGSLAQREAQAKEPFRRPRAAAERLPGDRRRHAVHPQEVDRRAARGGDRGWVGNGCVPRAAPSSRTARPAREARRAPVPKPKALAGEAPSCT